MKKKFFFVLFALVFLSACGYQPGYEDFMLPTGYGETAPENSREIDSDNDAENGHEITPEVTPDPPQEPPPKIAIITDPWWDDSPSVRSDWIDEIKARFGVENVEVHPFNPWGSGWTTSPMERVERFLRTEAEGLAIVNEIAADPEIRLLIVNPADHGTDYIIGILRELRDDIFIVYMDYRLPTGPIVNNPFRVNSLADAVSRADLILEFDTHGMARAFPKKAREMGVTALVFFYNTETWSEEIVFEESYTQRVMREISAELGLRFVEVDIAGEIQCGSSFAWFMSETIPPLIEMYGTDIVLFGLDNERVFWEWQGHGIIYLPMYSPDWFEPTPADVFLWSSPTDFHAYSPADYIEGFLAHLDETNNRGRVASWPMSSQTLFALAAAEYGIRWVNGEVLEGIDLRALELIMVEIIAEFIGIQQHGVSLTVFTENNTPHNNYILVLPDWLVY